MLKRSWLKANGVVLGQTTHTYAASLLPSFHSSDLLPPQHTHPRTLPGMLQSHIIRFMEPSAPVVGRATKPWGWSLRQALRSSCKRPRDMPPLIFVCCGLAGCASCERQDGVPVMRYEWVEPGHGRVLGVRRGVRLEYIYRPKARKKKKKSVARLSEAVRPRSRCFI